VSLACERRLALFFSMCRASHGRAKFGTMVTGVLSVADDVGGLVAAVDAAVVVEKSEKGERSSCVDDALC